MLVGLVGGERVIPCAWYLQNWAHARFLWSWVRCSAAPAWREGMDGNCGSTGGAWAEMFSPFCGLTHRKAWFFLTAPAINLCAASCQLAGLHLLVSARRERKCCLKLKGMEIPIPGSTLLFQSNISQELICKLILTELTRDNKLKTVIWWWISVHPQRQRLVFRLLL